MAQLMPLPPTVSCFSKIQIGFTFLGPAHPGSPGQRAVERVSLLYYLVLNGGAKRGPNRGGSSSFQNGVCSQKAGFLCNKLLQLDLRGREEKVWKNGLGMKWVRERREK